VGGATGTEIGEEDKVKPEPYDQKMDARAEAEVAERAELVGLLGDLLRIIGGSLEIERTVSDYDLARVQRAGSIVGED